MIHYQCDLCDYRSTRLHDLERAILFPNGRYEGRVRSKTKWPFDVCREHADALARILLPRGQGSRNSAAGSVRCVHCGGPAKTRLHLHRRYTNDNGWTRLYTHSGALCPRHARPFFVQLGQLGIIPDDDPATPLFAGIA